MSKQALTVGSEIWGDGREGEAKLRRAFSWLTRIGAGPKFGTLPIAYYQQEQCKALDALKDAASKHSINLENTPVRFANGWFQARVEGKWLSFASLYNGRVVAVIAG